jgi:hypothetical protein
MLTLAPDILTASAWAARATSALGLSTEMADIFLPQGLQLDNGVIVTTGS